MATGRFTRDTDLQLAAKKVFDAVFDFAWRALERSGLSGADRDDLAQSAAIAAVRRWPTYRQESGTPGQWLRGIVRNELRAFLREQAKQPALAPDEIAAALAEAPDPEERTATVDLADHLLGTLPAEQRRVVVLHDLAGLTYREIAVIEGISKSEAHERHKDAMAALAAAAARLEARELRSILPLPLWLASLSTRDAAGPAPTARTEAWHRAAPQLGLPPEAPRAPGRSRSLLRLAAAVAGVVLVGLLLARALDGCGRHPGPSAPPAPANLAPTPSPAPSEPAPGPSVSAGPVLEDGGPEAVAGQPSRPAPPADAGSAATDVEMVAMDKARSALASDKISLALDALDDYAKRFPGGETAASREELRRKTCARAAALGVADRRCPPPR